MKRAITGSSGSGKFLADSPAAKGAGRRQAATGVGINISSGICSDTTNCPSRLILSHTGGGTQSAPISKNG
jgi:hypothetical protein